MLRRLFRLILLAFGILIVTGVVLYFFGLRIVLDGGGGVQLRFVRTADQQADIVARHREAQRTSASAPDVAGPPAPPSGSTLAADAPRPDAGKPAAADPPATYWTDFRGPSRDGHYRAQAIRTDWPRAGLQPIWKQPIGGGYASFVAAHGRAFTIEQRGVQEVVAAYDVKTGRELWTHKWDALFSEMMGGDGPRATPTWFDNRVYALGATGELQCLDDATGRVIWRKNILEDNGAGNLQWGMAAAPLIVDDTVVVLPGGGGGRSVVAYNRHTGDRVWSALNDRASYSSPMLVTLGGVRQLIVFSASRLMGLAPGDGRVLWEYPWTTQFDINASQPLMIGGNRVFVSTGYGTGAAVIELNPEGSAGAAAGASANRFAVREVWRNIRMKNQFTSSVLHDGFIYGLDENILACVDAASGDLKWKGGRYGYGQVLLASGHLIVLSETGELALVRATPDRHEELARFAGIEGKTWNHPAIVDGVLLIRNAQEMAAFDLR